MKNFTFLSFSILIFISLNCLAQTPESIEKDLYRSYKKIDYWLHNQNSYAGDSLGYANDVFARKLRYYITKYPFTIGMDFFSLKKEQLWISTSSDDLLRIYSWDTQMGGTMHIYNDLLQYKANNKIYSTNLRDTSDEGDNGNSYDNIYSLKVEPV